MNNLFTHPYDKFETSFEAMLHVFDRCYAFKVRIEDYNHVVSLHKQP